jgi:outer membrane protein assembly factor BamD (BamD/ComL family)
MRFLRPLLGLALVWLTVVIFLEARTEMKKEHSDGGKAVLYFGGVVLAGGAAAVLLVTAILPTVGDAIGSVFFNPDEKVEKSPHAGALTAIARGDYETAVQEYLTAFGNDPHDTMALSEIVRLECEHLDNPDAAADMLEQALEREWTQEDAAFLTVRLVDVYWKYQHKVREARALLMQIIETMPGTRHAANAQHKLQEIERQLAMED